MADDRLTAHSDIIPLEGVPSAHVSVPLEQNPAAIYLASLGEGSRRTMRTALNTIGALLDVGKMLDADGQDIRCHAVPWASLRFQHTAAIRTALQARYAPATANKLLAALRRVLKEARRLGQMSADEFERASDIRNVIGTQVPRGRLLSDSEVADLMRICATDPTPAGARDAAIIALLRGTGMRRSDAAALDVDDYDTVTGILTIRGVKGRKDRLNYVGNGLKAALDDWLFVRGDKSGPLFYGIIKGGQLVPRRLADQGIAVICASRAIEANITAFTPHDMRRTFISGLLDAGADIVTVQRLVGHEDLATTSRYDRRSETAKQRAIDLVYIPYYPR